MENRIEGPRNTLREESGRVPASSPSKKAERRARRPGWGTRKNAVRIPEVENSTVTTKRARGASVDGAVGVGPSDMPAEHISRSLARLLRRGVRTATVREIGGVLYVVTKEIPEGVFVLRTADRITAYRAGIMTPAAGLDVVASVSVQDSAFSVATA